MATCNPFKVGDKVKIKEDPYGILSRAGFKLNTIYTVRQVDKETDCLSVKETLGCIHYTHFELYKEKKDMTQQTQQKTKRVPFTHELWEKYKDKGVAVTNMNGKVLEQFTYFNLPNTRLYAGVYDGLVGNYYSHHLFLEIPITTKRIPFNPELKDAKVFIVGDMLCFNTGVKEWHLFSNDIVVLLDYEDNIRIKHRSKVQMEIEEDV